LFPPCLGGPPPRCRKPLGNSCSAVPRPSRCKQPSERASELTPRTPWSMLRLCPCGRTGGGVQGQAWHCHSAAFIKRARLANEPHNKLPAIGINRKTRPCWALGYGGSCSRSAHTHRWPRSASAFGRAPITSPRPPVLLHGATCGIRSGYAMEPLQDQVVRKPLLA
jgi:hypothetical protein